MAFSWAVMLAFLFRKTEAGLLQVDVQTGTEHVVVAGEVGFVVHGCGSELCRRFGLVVLVERVEVGQIEFYLLTDVYLHATTY